MVTETEKSEFRRIKEGFIEKFCGGKGIDIGCGTYKIKPDVVEWDKNNGDATFVSTIEDSTYDYVYSSHCLEHLYNPVIAIFNWWRILKPNGYLIITVPDRDLYEKRKTLPSFWNKDHKNFYLMDSHEPPCTLGLIPIQMAR